MRLTNYNLAIKKNMSDLKIALFSDIHFSGDAKILNEILDEIKVSKPDFICIPGDMYDCYTKLDDFGELIEFIKKLSEYSRIVISLGNHDIKKRIDKQDEFYYPEDFIKTVNNIDNVYLLDNEMITIDGVCFYGLTIPFDAYYEKEYLDEFVSGLNIEFKENFNILLCHSPLLFLNKSIFKKIKNVDIIFSGHMHNGVIPMGIDKIVKSSRGFVSPKKRLFPKYARGLSSVNGGKTVLIVSKGIKTFHSFLPVFIRVFSFLYPANIEYVNLVK